MKMNVRGNDGFETPDFLYRQLDRVFNFTLDAACTTANCKAPRGLYFDQGIDALQTSWGGSVSFVIHRSAKKPHLSPKLMMKLSTAIVPLSSWYCPQIAQTAALSTNTSTKNSFTRFYPAELALWIRLPVERQKVIIPALSSSTLRKTSQQGSKIIVN